MKFLMLACMPNKDYPVKGIINQRVVRSIVEPACPELTQLAARQTKAKVRSS